MVLHNERTLLVAPNWMTDDTEESIVGTEWHQEAIGALAAMLQAVSDRRGAHWGVCEQVELSGLRHHNNRSYSPRPDVMILAWPLAGSRAAIPLSEAGTPLFVAEVASPSTLKNDLEGKREVYAAIGVPEYLIFDPAGVLLDTPVQAWRLAAPEATVYQDWPPEADSYWHSRSLDVALRPDGPIVAIRDRDGRFIERPRVASRRLLELEDRLREEQTTRQELEAELQRLRSLLGEQDQS